MCPACLSSLVLIVAGAGSAGGAAAAVVRNVRRQIGTRPQTEPGR